MKKLRLGAIALALATLAVLLAPAPAQAAGRSKPFLIRTHAGSNLCLEAAGTAVGSRVFMASCDQKRQTQMWTLENNERLQNVAGYLHYWTKGYLDYDISNGTGNGRKVQIWDYIANAENQKWRFGDPTLLPFISSKEDSRCLDVDISGGNNPPRVNSRVQMYTCNYWDNELWTQLAVPAEWIPEGPW